MFLMLVLASAATAQSPTFCAVDAATIPIATRTGPFSPTPTQLESALRPAIVALQDSVCACLSNRAREWPSQVKARVKVEPNAGLATLDIVVPPPMKPAHTAFITCVDEPSAQFEPFDYRSDMIVDGKSAPASFVYPLVARLEAGP